MEGFGDLNRIEGGTFPELIAADPEGESVVKESVFANTAHAAFFFAGVVEGHGVNFLCGIVADFGAREGGDGLAGDGDIDGFFEFGADGDGVSTEDWNTNAGGCDF